MEIFLQNVWKSIFKLFPPACSATYEIVTKTNKNLLVGISGEYERCIRTFHPADLISFWICWAVVVENEGDYIFDDYLNQFNLELFLYPFV